MLDWNFFLNFSFFPRLLLPYIDIFEMLCYFSQFITKIYHGWQIVFFLCMSSLIRICFLYCFLYVVKLSPLAIIFVNLNPQLLTLFEKPSFAVFQWSSGKLSRKRKLSFKVSPLSSPQLSLPYIRTFKPAYSLSQNADGGRP